MTAVDTSVLVSLLTGDHPRQVAAAQSLFAGGPIWIAIFLETNSVLRSVYGFEDAAIVEAFTKLLGLKNVQAEDESSVARALDLAARGIELADALHLASRPPGAAFMSFDRSLVRRAKRAGASDVAEVK
jgi:predicted nucleic acid-binding protein